MADHIKRPIDRKLEQYVGIHHGVIVISQENQIFLKLFLLSEIDVNIDEITAAIEVVNKSGKKEILNKKIKDIELRVGEVVWEFYFDCVSHKL